MEFDYDPAKDANVRAERSFGFAQVIAIFAGRVEEYYGVRQDYGEVGMVVVGQVGDDYYTVVYADRGSVQHIIAAWPFNRKERKVWLASA